MSKKQTVLMILDGYGDTSETKGNAIKLADTKNLDMIFSKYPYAKGYASGLDVGLPDGQMGNSEVGHLNIGAGRIVYQELTKISKAIKDGDFFTNEEFLKAINNAKKNNSDLHLFGLLSNGGVHSHTEHIFALLELCKKENFENVYLHAFLDGRDTPPTSGKGFLEETENKMKEIGVGKIATVSGRFYSMDRDKRWDRVKETYDALVLAKGETKNSVSECINDSYNDGLNDEFVKPTIILNDGQPTATIKENDSVIFYNFRPDRAREISHALLDVDFDGFEREKGFFNLTFVTFTEIDTSIKNKLVAFKPSSLENTLGEYVAKKGLKQLRIAETEKYAHVTFFFNGGVEAPNENEDRILIPSPKVTTYDLQPEMSAFEVSEKLVEQINANKYDLLIVNFANPDMVGHTGHMDACVKAIETVDKAVGQVYEAVVKNGASMFICADHGNADKLIDLETDEMFTAHTTNPVPFCLVNFDGAKGIKENGKLSDIAPTILEMMGLEQPAEMEGTSLIIK